jgi:hypothetical protein
MNLKKRALVMSVAALLLSLPPFASAQWEAKPYTEWTEKEAWKVLNNSPWGRTQVFSSPVVLFRDMPNRGPGPEASQSRPPNATHVNFRIRFLSAKPVRQALSRLVAMERREEINFDLAEHLKQIASGEFMEYIVITVSCDSQDAGANAQEALSLLHRRGTADLKNNTFLEIKGGKRIFLQEYQQPRPDGLGARFIFPRLVDGQPFITPESQEIRFFTELSGAYRLDRRYKVKEMIYEGKLEY